MTSNASVRKYGGSVDFEKMKHKKSHIFVSLSILFLIIMFIATLLELVFTLSYINSFSNSQDYIDQLSIRIQNLFTGGNRARNVLNNLYPDPSRTTNMTDAAFDTLKTQIRGHATSIISAQK